MGDWIRDRFLESQGWTVYRIPWKEVKTEAGKKYIVFEIKKLMEFLSDKKL